MNSQWEQDISNFEGAQKVEEAWVSRPGIVSLTLETDPKLKANSPLPLLTYLFKKKIILSRDLWYGYLESNK
ncbi:MAG: hypothetical protein ACFFBD_08090 [Candidatus Hodarchaeota archaeon]